MPQFIIRHWATQTLYDCRDYAVDAATPEEAAAKVQEALRVLHEGEHVAVDLRTGEPITDYVVVMDEFTVGALDPDEMHDSEDGFVLVDQLHGRKVRDVEPAEPEGAR